MLNKIIAEIHWSNESILQWMEKNNISSEEILKLISHNINANSLWIARILNKTEDKNVFGVKSSELLRIQNDANLVELKEIIRGDIVEEFAFTLLNGTPARSTKEEVILHLFTHGFHHIGQIAKIAAAEKITFPNLSYLGFAWSAEYAQVMAVL